MHYEQKQKRAYAIAWIAVNGLRMARKIWDTAYEAPEGLVHETQNLVIEAMDKVEAAEEDQD